MYDFTNHDKHGPAADFLEGLHCTVIENEIAVIAISKSINQYMYCTSKIFSDELKVRFGVDGCFQINSVDFFLSITKHLPGPIGSSVIGCVNYINKIGYPVYDPAKSSYSGLYKDENYALEEEVRGLWELKRCEKFNRVFKQPIDVDGAMSLSDDFLKSHRLYVENQKTKIQPVIIPVPEAVKYCTKL